MSKLTLGNTSEQDLGSGDFEIVVQIRNHQGNPTGKTKTFRSENPSQIAEFFKRQTGKPKRRGRRKATKQDVLPSAQEAAKILKQINQE